MHVGDKTQDDIEHAPGMSPVLLINYEWTGNHSGVIRFNEFVPVFDFPEEDGGRECK